MQEYEGRKSHRASDKVCRLVQEGESVPFEVGFREGVRIVAQLPLQFDAQQQEFRGNRPDKVDIRKVPHAEPHMGDNGQGCDDQPHARHRIQGGLYGCLIVEQRPVRCG